MRTYHRWVTVVVLLFALWYAITGLALQAMDLSALLSNAPASDPTMQGIRVGENGPPNFAVLKQSDYVAAPLPRGLDLGKATETTIRAARGRLRGAPISFLDLRVTNGRPVGQVLSHRLVYTFDALSGVAVGAPAPFKLAPLSSPSFRNTFKDVHRLRYFGIPFYAVDILFCIALLVMIYTGIATYLPLWKARARTGRRSIFWKAGGTWRMIHRGVAICAALFLAIVAVSGIVLSLSSLGVAYSAAKAGGKRPGLTADVSAPLNDRQLMDMLRVTREALARDRYDSDVRVIRLRFFAGMPQGIIVTGGAAQQLVYNASTGARAGMTEKAYPNNDMPFGWDISQTFKKIHRGDYIGIGGRGISVLTGLSLLYLAISGCFMYLDLWKRRRKAGRKKLFWR